MIMSTPSTRQLAMRIRFELARRDNPPLFDELTKFSKGTKRVNRLRTLAHEGLLAQRASMAPAGKVEARSEVDQSRSGIVDEVLVAASNELFGPAVDG
jgi:hypothetical protein